MSGIKSQKLKRYYSKPEYNDYNNYVGGSYGESYKGRVIDAESSIWFKTKDFSEAVYQVSCINYAAVSERDKAFKAICSVPMQHHFSVDKRFPPDMSYICLMYGPYSGLLSQLKAALAYKDRDKEKNREPSATSTRSAKNVQMEDNPNNLMTFSKADDGLQAWTHACSSILVAIGRREFTFQQKFFEDFFNLLWMGEDKEPVQVFVTNSSVPVNQTERVKVSSSRDDAIFVNPRVGPYMVTTNRGEAQEMPDNTVVDTHVLKTSGEQRDDHSHLDALIKRNFREFVEQEKLIGRSLDPDNVRKTLAQWPPAKRQELLWLLHESDSTPLQKIFLSPKQMREKFPGVRFMPVGKTADSRIVMEANQATDDYHYVSRVFINKEKPSDGPPPAPFEAKEDDERLSIEEKKNRSKL